MLKKHGIKEVKFSHFCNCGATLKDCEEIFSQTGERCCPKCVHVFIPKKVIGK